MKTTSFRLRGTSTMSKGFAMTSRATGNKPQSEITNRQSRHGRDKNAKAEIAHWGETNETFDRPMSAFSGSWLEGSEHRILGDPGTQRSRWVIMAVQGFSRIRVNSLQDGPASLTPLTVHSQLSTHPVRFTAP
jgi:hypothetical protein